MVLVPYQRNQDEKGNYDGIISKKLILKDEEKTLELLSYLRQIHNIKNTKVMIIIPYPLCLIKIDEHLKPKETVHALKANDDVSIPIYFMFYSMILIKNE